jgi:ABC-2 type transport system ATP-binding protein
VNAPANSTTPAAAAPAVRARGLTRRFGDFIAVDGLDLDVRPGEIFGFLGANGAGKTTAIRMLCGLLPPTSGEAQVAGVPVGRHARELKRRIGYMSQRFSLYDDLTVGENLEFFGGIYGLARAALHQRCAELLPVLGLADSERRLASSLPLGYKQRLALGCALLHRPAVVFLDEPTGGVDPVARRRFWDLIYAQAAAGVTVFVTTHYMDEAEYCGRVSIMVQGRLVALDTPGGLKAATGGRDMQEVFLKLVDA